MSRDITPKKADDRLVILTPAHVSTRSSKYVPKDLPYPKGGWFDEGDTVAITNKCARRGVLCFPAEWGGMDGQVTKVSQ